VSKWHDSMRGEYKPYHLIINMNRVWKLIYVTVAIFGLSFLAWIIVCGVSDPDVTFSVGTFNGGIHK
jgi:hypothetical protein